jgi:AraC-like DNA-binding protein
MVRRRSNDGRVPADRVPAEAASLASIWFQEPLNRRETFESPGTLISEITILGQISLQRAVPRALGPDRHADEVELHLLRDGRMRLWIDSPKGVYELHGGMASLTQPGQVHSAEGELMLPGRWMWLRFMLPKDQRGSMPGLTARETAVVRSELAAVKPPVFHYSQSLEYCMERLLEEHRRPTPESGMVARGILHELIAWIIRDHRSEQLRHRREPDTYSPPITKVIDWLRDHLDENVSVSDLADVAGLSPSYFRRWFHREVGSSPSDYVTAMRIERSKRLLTETDRSITQIAMELGYNTSAYFTAVFHRETGTTPSDFRRQLRALAKGHDQQAAEPGRARP